MDGRADAGYTSGMWLSAVLLAASAAWAAPACTRVHDRELEAALPASLHARLASLPGPRAKAAASFMLRHPDLPLRFAVRPSKASRHPTLPLMSERAVMQFMAVEGYTLDHGILHEEGRSEYSLARRPADLAALTDALLPIWVHELSHASRTERPVRWPVSPTIEDELVACYRQALFSAEVLAADPAFAGLREVYRLQSAALAGGREAKAAYRLTSQIKRTALESLELAAASGEEFERLYRKAYGTDSSLRDPLTAGLRITHRRAELARLLGSFDLLPSAQRASAEVLLDYGKSDDAFWLDSKATMAARDDAEAELKELRRELDAARPALRAWFVAARGGPVDWKRLVESESRPVAAIAPEDRPR